MTITTESRNRGRRGHLDPISPYYKDLGERLRRTREARRYSLADVQTVSKGRWYGTAIGSYERGQRRIGLEDLRDLAEFYGVSAKALLPDEPDLEALLAAIGVASVLDELQGFVDSLRGVA